MAVTSGMEILPPDPPLQRISCRRCGFLTSRSSPLDRREGEYYRFQYSAKLQDMETDFFSYQSGLFFHQALNRFVLGHEFPPRGRLLDIGCGKGFFLEGFAKLHPLWRLEGVDPSPVSLRYAREKAPGARLHERFFSGEDYPRNAYNLICMHTVLNRVHPGRTLQEAVELLAPGGVLSIEVVLLPQAPYQLYFADHPFLFFREQLLALTESLGLDLLRWEQVGQLARFLFEKNALSGRGHRRALLERAPAIRRFTQELLVAWQNLITQVGRLRDMGGRLAFYGAGTTAAILLSATNLPEFQLRAVADDNPHKIGNTLWGRTVRPGPPATEGVDAVVLCSGPEGLQSMRNKLAGQTKVLALEVPADPSRTGPVLCGE